MPLVDTLLRLAEPPSLFEARWSAEILAEVTRTLTRRFGKSPEKALKREIAMRKFFPGSLVANNHRLIAEMENHPKDRHVLAAAVMCRADYLVTFNLRDFPTSAQGKYLGMVIGPSAFLQQLWKLNHSVVEQRLSKQASDIAISREILLNRLAKLVPDFVKTIRDA